MEAEIYFSKGEMLVICISVLSSLPGACLISVQGVKFVDCAHEVQ